MSTYSFTVRATDNAGAFAERNFSISLRKTRYDRVAGLGNPSGSAFTAAVRAPVYGSAARTDPTFASNVEHVTFSGGRFVSLTSNSQIYESNEGVFWNLRSLNYPVPAGCSVATVVVTKFVGGKWMIFGSIINNTSNVVSCYEWSTTDWKTITAVGHVSPNGTPYPTGNTYGVLSFDYDPQSDTTVASFSTNGTNRSIWTRKGATWVINPTTPAEASTSPTFHSVLFAGGVWMLLNQARWMYLSRDTSYWYTQQLPSGLDPINSYISFGLTYVNGKVAVIRQLTSGSSPQIFLTSDLGKTWTTGPAVQPVRLTSMNTNLPFATAGDGTYFLNSSNGGARYSLASLNTSSGTSVAWAGAGYVGFRPYDPLSQSIF